MTRKVCNLGTSHVGGRLVNNFVLVEKKYLRNALAVSNSSAEQPYNHHHKALLKADIRQDEMR